MALIDRDKAYIELTNYYHHRTELQHMALKDALCRVPTVEASDIFNKGLLTGLKAAGKNAIPIEWLEKKVDEYINLGLNSVAKELRTIIYEWEEKK